MTPNQANPAPSVASGPQPAPAAVATLAERRLRSNPYLALKNLSCTFDEGVLTLHGCLPTYYLKQIALASVAGIEGVGRIDNQIRVTSPAIPQRPAGEQ